MVELPNGDWALPYTGYLYPHKFPRGAWAYDPGYMRWPKGRLVALEAKDSGEFTSVAFLAPGERLRINAVTKRAGHVLVEACDFNGKPLPGHSFDEATPLTGDHYRTPVTWRGANAGAFEPGKPLVLRFRMEQAKIYSLDFE